MSKYVSKLIIYPIFKLALAALAIGFCLCLYPIATLFPRDATLFYVGVSTADKQGMILICTIVYFIVFTSLIWHRADKLFWQVFILDAWLIAVFIIALASSVRESAIISNPVCGSVLLGSVLGKGFRSWATWPVPFFSTDKSITAFFFLFLVAFIIGSLWNLETSPTILYHDNTRWSGSWADPNLYGLIMGTGIILSVGIFGKMLNFKTQNTNSQIKFRCWKSTIYRWTLSIFCILAVGLMGRGLLHSYSRGAWLGTVFGLIYLGSKKLNHIIRRTQENSSPQDGRVFVNKPFFLRLICYFRRSRLPLTIVVISFLVLIVWNYHQTDRIVLGRVMSIGNVNDFSWRKRMVAWEGMLQIMAESPWLGDHPEKAYEQFYSPPNIDNGSAFQTNDLFMIGGTLGLPALVCLFVYFWQSLSRKQLGIIGDQSPEIAEINWLQITCRAGVIVLGIGFWFDGGLFKLATASIFWILLEIGNIHFSENVKNN